MSGWVAGDTAIGMEVKVDPLMSGDLKNDERESKLEDTLECDQAPKRVVVALGSRAQKPQDEQDVDYATQAPEDAAENRKADGAVETYGMGDLVMQPS
jgi:hypothetical protein